MSVPDLAGTGVVGAEKGDVEGHLVGLQAIASRATIAAIASHSHAGISEAVGKSASTMNVIEAPVNNELSIMALDPSVWKPRHPASRTFLAEFVRLSG